MIIYTKINSTSPPVIGDMVYYPHTKTIRTQVHPVYQFGIPGLELVFFTGFGNIDTTSYFATNFNYNSRQAANSFFKHNNMFGYVIDKEGVLCK